MSPNAARKRRNGLRPSRATGSRCGYLYSTYEFIQQGIQEHGEDVVKSTFSFKGGTFQIKPNQVLVCQNCGLIIIGVGVYNYHLYTDPQGRPEYACGSIIVIVMAEEVLA